MQVRVATAVIDISRMRRREAAVTEGKGKDMVRLLKWKGWCIV